MPLFKLYHLDPFTGHIDRVEELHASDSVEAIHSLQNRDRPKPLELWVDGRKICHLEPMGSAPDMLTVMVADRPTGTEPKLHGARRNFGAETPLDRADRRVEREAPVPVGADELPVA